MTDASEACRWIESYRAARSGAALFDLGNRTQIELKGSDRASFLHNLCTNEVRRLSPGAGCEAFLTTVQGKTLGHLLIYVGPQSIVVDTVAGQAATLLKHFDHYLVCEQVTLVDRSEEWSELLLAGPLSAGLLERLFGQPAPSDRMTHAQFELAGKSVWVRRADIVDQRGYLISASAADITHLRDAILTAGAADGAAEAFEAARIEQGFPWFGVDLTDVNLPQELGRDALAISFVKGCYLGQETVARIDALGHVNKMLVGVRMTGPDLPPAGTELTAGEAQAGSITSIAYSPKLETPLALAYVRRGFNAPGSALTAGGSPAEVTALPLG